jgi:hypothetical protein
MSEISKFFNSAPGDTRTYQASDFADYFGKVLSSGLLHTDNVPAMQVKCEGTDLRTYVEPGQAIMQGYAYENTSNLYLNHSLPEATLDRIDRIVLRLDKRNQSRFVKLFVVQGVSGTNPVAPNLQRDDFIYELSLAQIRIRANTSTLVAADLIDERLDESLCGLVSSLISIPTDQLQAFILAKMDELNVESDNFEAQLTQNLADYETEFNTWFDSLQSTGYATPDSVQLVDDKVDDLQTEVTTHKADDVRHVTTADRTKWNATDNAKFKKSNSSYTDNDTSQTFTDAFCTVDSLVTVVITSATPPKGVWSVNSADGSFTITSTVAEDNDITFDYFIQKAVG